MSKYKLSYPQILEHLERIDKYLHMSYKEFIIPFQGNCKMEDIALGMMLHVGLVGYEPIIKYEKLDEGTAGHICLNNNPDRKVYITLSNGKDVQRDSQLATLAHEICHKLLYAHNCYFPLMGDYNETLTDIATIYVGFGKLTINGCEIQTYETDGFGTRTKTTTHYTGYLGVRDYISAYKTVCLVNNIPQSDYEYGLDKSKLTILQNNQQIQNIRVTGKDLSTILKAYQTSNLSTDSAFMRDIIQLEEYVQDLKRRISKHQKETISKYKGLENDDGKIINPYGVLLVQSNCAFQDEVQTDIERRLKSFEKILDDIASNNTITDRTLNIVCPVCGYSKENALKEHKKIMIRCPKCYNVFYWDASLSGETGKQIKHEHIGFLRRLRNIFK